MPIYPCIGGSPHSSWIITSNWTSCGEVAWGSMYCCAWSCGIAENIANMDRSCAFTFFQPHLQHIATQTHTYTHTHTKRFQAALLVSRSWQILFTSSYQELLFNMSLVVNRSGCQLCHNVLGMDNEQYQTWWKATAWLKRNIFDIAFPAASNTSHET